VRTGKFGLKSDEDAGCWRKLHNEELRDLYSWKNVIIMSTLRKMRWTDNVARMGRR
jgi:hypothetical protein